ncbi:nucleolar complex protein 2 homolog [Aplysia californica]|uniref:Nucleolar complex protein 2 homolog n=1 Tax=Aplysia californica TaxID=6500 RepID=A0ABM0JAL1_APLCA|nr:nucleolar complex protein 2 homolog [Aplysia californica]
MSYCLSSSVNMATRSVGMGPTMKSKKLADMSVNEFFSGDFDSESESSTKSADSDSKILKSRSKAGSKEKLVSKKTKVKAPNQKQKRDNVVNANNTNKNMNKVAKRNELQTEPSASLDPVKSSKVSKQSLARSLQENDPEFYDFLKGEDKNLLSNLETLSDDDSEVDEDELNDVKAKNSSPEDYEFEKELINMSSGDESDSDEETSSNVHKLPQQLEVASDDSEAEDVDEEEAVKSTTKKKGGTLVTNRMVNNWSEELKTKPSQTVFRQVVSAFHAAVQEAGGAEDQSTSKYRVEGSLVFNSVVRLCLERIAPTLQNMLHLTTLAGTSGNQTFEKSGAWKKIKVEVKSYISDLLDLLAQLSETAMINAMLKHVHKLILFYATFPKLSKMLLKRIVKMWTGGDETTQVLAFLCINKLVHMKQDTLLEPTLKQMYTAYVSNCKFTSPTTLPQINFMQRSLVELFNIDQTLAYQYAFIYIRQLAIHLRNAISVKKKNTCQAVYNWQYIHCLSLWVKLLTTTCPSEILQPMIYPLTQTIIGTIKLLPTARFYPLRFHCVKLLNSLSAKTDTFIPTLPFLLEVIEQTDFNKRHKTVSLKPFNFAVILKFSKSQLHEKAFKDGLVDQLYELFLESYHNSSCSIGFPELIIPSVIQLKDFLKKCKIANYCKQFKQIVDKAMEQATFISGKRKNCGVRLDDSGAVSQWENNIKSGGTPLDKFYASWRKLRDRELQHELSNKEAISGAAIDIPTVERKLTKRATPQEREDFSKLFENESDSDDETRFLLKEERPDQLKRKRKRNDESDSEDYSDFDDEELEQLAQSASSGEETDGSDGVENGQMSSDPESDEEEKGRNSKVKQNSTVKRQRLDREEDGNDGDDILEDFNLDEYDSDS